MKTKRLKGNIINKILIALILLVLISTLILTLAYFQDKKEYSGTLDFGNIKLKVSGGVNSETSTLVFDTARKKNNDSTWTGKYMPGDMVDLNLTVGLENNSEPAYYIISITDDNDVFESAYYYSDGTKTGNTLNVYVFDRAKTYKQSDTTKTELTGSDLKNVGKLSAGDTNAQNLTISAKIDENFEEQGIKTTVYCKIFAIQQANLSETDARAEIMGNIVGLDTSKYRYVNYLESTGEQWIDTGYVYKTDPKIEMAINPTQTKDMFICGNRGRNTPFVFNPDVSNSNAIVNYIYGEESWKQMPSTSMKLGKWIKISFGKAYKENGTLIKSIAETYDFSTNTLSIYLFHANGGGTAYISTVKMGFCRIFDGSSLVRNYVPCLRSSDNKPGMFDTVNNVFYVNQATGADFLWG